MSSQALSLMLCSALASAQAPARASLQIDASDLGEAGPFVAERLEARAELVLRDGDVLPGHRESDPVIVVRVDTLGEATGYRFSYEVQRSGVLVADTRGSGECRLCNEGELSAQIDAAISRLLPRLAPEETAVETDAALPPAAAPTDATAPAGWTVGRLGGAGIILAASGGLTLGLGTGLAVAEPVLLDGGDRNRTITVAGVGVAVAGVALLATGVAMMLIERRRGRQRSPRQAWTPHAPSRIRF